MGYPKHIYDKAWQTIDARAAAARTENASRRSAVLKTVPMIAEIERQMAFGAAGITKSVLTAPDKAGELIEELARQNLALQQRRQQLLTDNGFPADYLEEQFGCPACKDKGYIDRDMCLCLRQLLQEQAYTELRAAAPAELCTFGSFSLDYYPETTDESGQSPRGRMKQVLHYCQGYATGFSPRSESLLLIGQTGLGKTHLSISIASEVTQGGYGVVYTPVQKLMDTLEAEKFSYDSDKKEQYTEHVRAAQTCDLLVLDDLGTEFITQFSTSVLYNIINTRQVEGRPTIISTNLELPDIEQKYSQRMVSRLVCAYQVLRFAGKDIRFLKKSQTRQTV